MWLGIKVRNPGRGHEHGDALPGLGLGQVPDFDPLLLSAGVGASFLDGLVRLDLARALRTPTGWRVDLYLDAAL